MTPTLIMTRPQAQSESFAADVAAVWGRPLNTIVSPLIAIVPVPATAPDVENLIFTSANGVDAAVAFDVPRDATAWCVGPKTAQAAQRAGFRTITGPGDAAGLIAHIIAQQAKGGFAHIRGRHTRGDVTRHLREAGMPCVDVVAYDQQPCALSDHARKALLAPAPIIFPLFSPRTCTILAEQGPFAAPVRAIAISEAVKHAIMSSLGWDVRVSDAPHGKAMLDAVISELGR